MKNSANGHRGMIHLLGIGVSPGIAIGPVYRLEIDMLGRMFAQDAWLYVDIMLATPERREAIGRLARKCSQIAALAGDNDRDGLIAEFEKAKETLGRETARALAESNRLIEAFGTILAAGEAERDQA